MSTMRSLAKSFKAKSGLRNEPLGLPKTEPMEDLPIDGSIYQSYTRLRALKQSENIAQD